MSVWFKKIIQIATALLIAGALAYGLVYAGPDCCVTAVSVCIPTSGWNSGGYNCSDARLASPSHRRNSQLQSRSDSEYIQVDYNSKNTCCDSAPFQSRRQTEYFSRTNNRDFYPLQTDESITAGSHKVKNILELQHLPASTHTTPIFLLKRSILC